MPQQLIYTSSPRGVVAGRSGHCTVARSSDLREALMLQLEKLSYYQHLSLTGGKERPIYSSRMVDIRGARYHVLSRIQDAGLDFTGRTNFLAHHLVFTPEEIRLLPSPPVILQKWNGWVNSWSQEPRLLDAEDWSGLSALAGTQSIPAKTWQQVTGDAVNGFGLLDLKSGAAFGVDNLSDQQVLQMFAEALELLELRDPRRDFRATAWQYTFTTSIQEQDNPADFRWRCLHSDNPASNRFAGPGCRPLADVETQQVTSEETVLARSGRVAPQITVQPVDKRVTEGTPAKFSVKAEGVPAPTFQWFSVDGDGNGESIVDGVSAELVLSQPPLGISRYVVRASNALGESMSEVVTLSVEPKLRIRPSVQPATQAAPQVPKVQVDKNAELDSLNQTYVQNEAAQKPRFKWPWMSVIVALITGAIAMAYLKKPFAVQTIDNATNQPSALADRTESSTNVDSFPSKTNFIAVEPASGATSTSNQPFRVMRADKFPAPTNKQPTQAGPEQIPAWAKSLPTNASKPK